MNAAGPVIMLIGGSLVLLGLINWLSRRSSQRVELGKAYDSYRFLKSVHKRMTKTGGHAVEPLSVIPYMPDKGVKGYYLLVEWKPQLGVSISVRFDKGRYSAAIDVEGGLLDHKTYTCGSDDFRDDVLQCCGLPKESLSTPEVYADSDADPQAPSGSDDYPAPAVSSSV